MFRKSTLFFFYLALLTSYFSFAQKSYYTYIISPEENGYQCGGKVLMGRIFHIPTDKNETSEFISYNHENEFFLEFLDSKQNVIGEIRASKIRYTDMVTPVFELPDTLKFGNNYNIRYRSTSPEIRTIPTEITFGAGKVPFSLDFSQTLTHTGKQPFTYSVPLKIKYPIDEKKLSSYFSNGSFKYSIKVSNGQNFESYNINPTVSLNLKDSITTFKINEIKNSCGVTGNVTGETKIIWRQNFKKLYVEHTNKYQSVCEGTNLTLSVFGMESKTQKVIVEIGKNNDFAQSKLLFSKEVEIKNGILDINTSQGLVNNNYYSVRIKSLDGSQISNSLEFYLYRKNIGIQLSYGYMENGNLMVWFNQVSSTGQTEYGGGLTYVELNNVDITPLMGNNWSSIQIPVPRKDTTFKITKAVNGCGTINQSSNSINFNSQLNRYVQIIPEKRLVCEGETISYKLNDTDETFLNDIEKKAFIYVWGRQFNSQTNSYQGNSVYKYYYLEKGSYNRQTKTVTFKIPNNISKDFYDVYGNQKYTLEYGYIYHEYYYKGRFVSYNYPDVRIYFSPIVSLTQKQINIDGSGIVKLPIKYLGNDSTKVSINNVPYTIINSKVVPSNCSGCQNNNGLDSEIRLYVEKNTTFRITNVENVCSVGIGIGETTVIVNQVPSIVLDDSKNDKDVCVSSKGLKNKFSIKFEKKGNWSNISTQLTGRVIYKIRNSTDIYRSYQINNDSEFSFDVENYYNLYKLEITIFGADGISSQTITMYPTELPSYYNLYSSSAEISFTNNIYTYYYQPNSTPLNIEVSANKSEVVINNKIYPFETSNGSIFSYFSIPTKDIITDTTFVIQKLQNVCGSVEINKKIKLIKKDIVINGAWDDTYNSEEQTTPCAGTKRFIKYYYGNIAPVRDSLIVQLGRRKNNSNEYTIDFFDVPTKKYALNKIVYTIPDTCTGTYFWRVRSFDNTMISKVVSLSFFYEKPSVKLTTLDGKNEILPEQASILKISSNIDKSRFFRMKMNNGEILSNYAFGHEYLEIINDTTKQITYKFTNTGYRVYPKENTEYRIEEVFNDCGTGKAEGVVSVKVQPSIELNMIDKWYKRDFCVNDSLSITLKYNGEIPKDTLFGLYLNNYSDSKYFAELATFKPNSNQIKVKIPENLITGYYYIQVRKFSRKNKNGKLYDLNYKYDSLRLAESRREFDSNTEQIAISTLPNVEISGNSEIFVGQSATINVYSKNLNNQNSLISKDTISYNGAMPYYYTFSDGSKHTVFANSGIKVTPNKSTSYTLSSVQNACGLGKVSGTAYVKVLPKTEQRIEFIGFLRKYTLNERVQTYYNSTTIICQGQKDSMDVRVYGLKTIDLKKVQTLISDKSGVNFTQLTLTGATIIDTLEGGIKLRTFFKIPDNLFFGYEYKFKTIIEDEILNSNTSANNSFIYELPTGILAGTKQFVRGEKVEGVVKLTGDAPWFFTVKDEKDLIVFNNVPTKNDTLNKFKDYIFKPIYTQEYKIDFLPENTNTYKVSEVYNNVCGLGKIGNEALKVELILDSEPSIETLVSVFPNPTVEHLNLNLQHLKGLSEIELYSLNGTRLMHLKIIDTELSSENSISMKPYPTGIYYLKVINNKLTKTFKVSKF